MLAHPHGPADDVLQLRDNDGRPALWYALYGPLREDEERTTRLAVAEALRSRGGDMTIADADSLLRRHRQPQGARRSLSPLEDFCCPISCSLMRDPVMLVETGHSYERVELTRWLAGNDRDPITNVRLESKAMMSNHALRKSIAGWQAKYGGNNVLR